MKPESNIIDTVNQNLFEVIYQMTGYIPLQSELKEIIDAVEKDKNERLSIQLL